jgi:hypothetical protein
MPGLILGDKVVEAVPQGPNRLLVRTKQHPEQFSWDSAPTVFDDARQLGFDTALAGWFHPYGRVIHRNLTKCNWTAGWLLSGIEEPFQQESWPHAMWDRAGLQIAVLPLIGHLPACFRARTTGAKRPCVFPGCWTARSRSRPTRRFGLVLIHLPVPHPPAFYDRTKGVITATGAVGYGKTPGALGAAERRICGITAASCSVA